MQMIATITRPTSGRILFHGQDIAKRPNELRRRLGYLPQDFGVYDNLTATEFLTYFAALKGVRSRQRVLEMLESVNLHGVANRTVGGFSGGMKDPEERVRFRNVLSEIGFGKLVILSTHIVSDVESIATEIAVMKNGALLTMATPETLLRMCEGHVWQSVVPSEQFDQLRTTLKISSAVRKPDGVHIRFVGPSPEIAATPAEPELEDAFLYLMNFGEAAQPPPLP